jgi:5'-deoxynucleotidase YfbR-like HD superfamily hydrolase
MYEQYEKSIMNRGVTAFAKDLEQMVLEFLEESTSEGTFVTESGDVEDWKFNKKEFKESNLKKLSEFLQHINSSTVK